MQQQTFEHVFKTRPFDHQLEALNRSINKRFFALFMEQGTGKTKVTIDTAAYLYNRGAIDGMLIAAPNEVDAQWIDEQLPTHMPETTKYVGAVWTASSRKAERACMEMCKGKSMHMRVLAMNHEAFATARGVNMARQFLASGRMMFVVDESHAIKGHKAARTQAIIKLGERAAVRRILTGTPEGIGPFDLYAQYMFLDKRIINIDSFVTFKHKFGVFTMEQSRYTDKNGRQQSRQYEALRSYKNTELLYKMLAPYTYSVRKAECLDLPEKLYSVRFVQLTKAQLELYTAIKKQGIVLLHRANKGEDVALAKIDEMDHEQLSSALVQKKDRLTMTIKLTTMLRMQQVLGGFITDDDGNTTAIESDMRKLPRVEALMDIIANTHGKLIVWCQFRAEVQMLQRVLQDAAYGVGILQGGVSPTERTRTIERFKDPDNALRILVAHPRTAGVGLNLTVAATVVYYSNSYSYILRAQSEDRVHRIGQSSTVNVYDLDAHAVGTDATIRKALQGRKEMAEVLLTWSSREMKE